MNELKEVKKIKEEIGTAAFQFLLKRSKRLRVYIRQTIKNKTEYKDLQFDRDLYKETKSRTFSQDEQIQEAIENGAFEFDYSKPIQSNTTADTLAEIDENDTESDDMELRYSLLKDEKDTPTTPIDSLERTQTVFEKILTNPPLNDHRENSTPNFVDTENNVNTSDNHDDNSSEERMDINSESNFKPKQDDQYIKKELSDTDSEDEDDESLPDGFTKTKSKNQKSPKEYNTANIVDDTMPSNFNDSVYSSESEDEDDESLPNGFTKTKSKNQKSSKEYNTANIVENTLPPDINTADNPDGSDENNVDRLENMVKKNKTNHSENQQVSNEDDTHDELDLEKKIKENISNLLF